MHDVKWCRAEVGRYESHLWEFGNRAEQFGRQLAEIRTRWNDSAAHLVYQQFLDPFGQATEQMTEKLQRQYQSLVESLGCLESAFAAERIVHELLKLQRDCVERILRDVKGADHLVDGSLHATEEARNLAQSADAALNEVGYP